MPRAVDEVNNAEDMLDDAAFERWESASVDRGEKIVWDVGTTLVAKFIGVEIDELSNDSSESGTGFDPTPAAIFQRLDGTYCWSWLPSQLKRAMEGRSVNKVKPGDTVRIKCVREEYYDEDRTKNPTKIFEVKIKPR